MKIFTCVALFFVIAMTASAQQAAAQILADKEVNSIFTDAVKKKLKIPFPVFRVYGYTNKGVQFYTLLTESRDSIGKKKDTISFKIKAITVKKSANELTPVWETADAVNRPKGEQAIWFWSRYSSIEDVTGDGIADPIIAYGTAGANHFEDGRVVIVTYYNGQKIFIRHQNGTLDPERKLQVDRSFYNLPAALQAAVKQKMTGMAKRMQALFPVDWEKSMQAKKTFIKN